MLEMLAIETREILSRQRKSKVQPGEKCLADLCLLIVICRKQVVAQLGSYVTSYLRLSYLMDRINKYEINY